MLVKICGPTSVESALTCANAGANFLGLNFYPKSARFIDLPLAQAIIRQLPGSCTPVGLFVNRPVAEVRETASSLGLRWLQLHGDEPNSDIAELMASGFSVIRAFKIGTEADLAQVAADLRLMQASLASPNAVLLDAKGMPGQHGGTGRTIPPELLSLMHELPLAGSRRLPDGTTEHGQVQLILAGGLNPGNVTVQVRAAGSAPIWMVDTASGVETAPGVKNDVKARAFIKAVRG